MSINVYLNNKVHELDGFKSQPYKDNSGDNMTFNGMNVFNEKGRLYFMWSADAVIPDELKDLVEGISCYETIPQMGRRESGIYRHESAECELTPEDYGNAKREKPMYKLKIKAKRLEDIQALMHKVKTGSIRPDESYEGQQIGMSRAELEAGLERALGMTEDLLERLNRLKADFQQEKDHFHSACDKNVRFRQLAAVLREKALRWPFCTKNGVARLITEILEDRI